MKRIALLTGLLIVCAFGSFAQQAGDWVQLFSGKLDNWKVGENAGTFTTADGMIVVNGPTAHLFYNGEYKSHDFKNFELKLDIMTTPGSNSGVYIHTNYQESSWPKAGYEIQVNNSHTDWRRTGSVYGIQDVKDVYVKDDEWFTMDITVQGKRIVVKVNDKVINDYTEPADVQREKGDEQRVLSHGTVALQGHDPKSKVYYRNIMIRPLP